jgi:hypothetical protein
MLQRRQFENAETDADISADPIRGTRNLDGRRTRWQYRLRPPALLASEVYDPGTCPRIEPAADGKVGVLGMAFSLEPRAVRPFRS